MNKEQNGKEKSTIVTKTRVIVALVILLGLSIVETEFVKSDRDALLDGCPAEQVETPATIAKEEG